MYLAIRDAAMGCKLCQHDESGRKEMAVHCLSKKFLEYEFNVLFSLGYTEAHALHGFFHYLNLWMDHFK